MSFLFGEKKTPKEQAREWTSELNKQKRVLEREANRIEREELKIVAAMKASAKKNQLTACKTLAKSIVKSRATRDNMLAGATRINSIVMSIKHNVATASVMGAMTKSTDIMMNMSKLVSIKEVADVTRSMAKEMAKSGLIGEMVDEAISSTDSADMEAEVDSEVDRVLYEITEGQLGAVPDLKKREQVKANVSTSKEEEAATSSREKEKEAEIQARMQKLT